MLVVKNPPANAGDIRDMGLTPGSGNSPGRGHGNPLQHSYLENPTDRGAWQVQSTWLQRVGHNWNDLALKKACHKRLFSVFEKPLSQNSWTLDQLASYCTPQGLCSSQEWSEAWLIWKDLWGTFSYYWHSIDEKVNWALRYIINLGQVQKTIQGYVQDTASSH